MSNYLYNHHCNIHIYQNCTNLPMPDYEVIEETDDEERGNTPDGYCTMCGKKLDDFDRQENFGFDYQVGYGSVHDCEILHARFCCKCFDEIIDVISSASVFNPVVNIYE